MLCNSRIVLVDFGVDSRVTANARTLCRVVTTLGRVETNEGKGFSTLFSIVMSIENWQCFNFQTVILQ